MKTCSKCGETKLFEEFSKDKRARLGLQSTCKRCSAERSRLWFKANPERHNETSRRLRPRYREKAAVAGRARKQARWDRVLQQARASSASLSDTYVARLLMQHGALPSATAVPAELIEAKREHLRVVRAIKEKRNGRSQEDENA